MNIRYCWSCGTMLLHHDELERGNCDDCKQARDKAMDDKIILDDRGTFNFGDYFPGKSQLKKEAT